MQHFSTPEQVKMVLPQVNVTGCQIALSLLKGTQKIFPSKKTQGQERDFVAMLMCLVRFKEPYDTDILFTYNVPDKHSADDESNCDPGSSQKFTEFLAGCETDFYKHMLPNFVVSGDQAMKDLLGM